MQNLQEPFPSPEGSRPSPAVSNAPPDAAEEILKELSFRLGTGSHLPLYRQISSQIEDWIEEGRLREGDQLASERRMTELLQVSRRTVRAALADLIERRYVSSTHGRGNFVLTPPSRRELRFLAVERFSSSYWGTSPQHYDLIHEAEEKGNWTVHYKYTPNLERLRDILRKPPSGYHGMFILRPTQEWLDELIHEENAALHSPPIPLLIAERDLSGTSFNFISPNHFGQAFEGTKKLLALGHRRIGFISGPMNIDYLRMAREGHLRAMAEAGFPTDHEEDILSIPMRDPAVAEKLIIPFLAARHFSAVVVVGTAFASPFEKAVQKSSIVVPDQLSALLIIEQYVLDRLTMRWTAHLFPSQSVIDRSLEALADLSLGRAQPPIQKLIPHLVVEGATCGPAPGD